LKVAKSTYYDTINRQKSKTEIERDNLTNKILDIFNNSKQTYGCVKIRNELIRQGVGISLGRVLRIMQKLGIKSVHSHKFKTKKRKDSDTAQNRYNILNQQFLVDATNKVWVSDITYIRVGCKWAYLCVVQDLFARKIVAWDIKFSMNTELVLNTVKKAWIKRECQGCFILL